MSGSVVGPFWEDVSSDEWPGQLGSVTRSSWPCGTTCITLHDSSLGHLIQSSVLVGLQPSENWGRIHFSHKQYWKNKWWTKPWRSDSVSQSWLYSWLCLRSLPPSSGRWDTRTTCPHKLRDQKVLLSGTDSLFQPRFAVEVKYSIGPKPPVSTEMNLPCLFMQRWLKYLFFLFSFS